MIVYNTKSIYICPVFSWYRPLLDAFLEENPDLDLWQAADPYRWVRY